MGKTYTQFKNEVLGHCYDIDRYYGAQCWDGTAYYQRWLGYPVIHTDIHGYACDIWESRKTNGMLKNFTEVHELKAGDIVVFRKVNGWTPLSHIAIFDSDAGNGYGWFLGQNQGAKNGAFSLQMLPYFATFDTAFRPNCFINASTKPTQVQNANNNDIWVDGVVKIGSTVKSVPMKATAYKNGEFYFPQLMQWIPEGYVSEYDASDGAKDNYIANLNATMYLDPCKVEAVNQYVDEVKIHGRWVKAGPLLVKK